MIVTTTGEVIISTENLTINSTNPFYLANDSEILNETRLEILAFLANKSSNANLTFKISYAKTHDDETYYSVYINHIIPPGIKPDDMLFYASFCQHEEFEALLNFWESSTNLLHGLYVILNVGFLLALFFLIGHWSKNFDKLVMNPIRQMSEKLHRIVKSAYSAPADTNKKITPDDILIKVKLHITTILNSKNNLGKHRS